MCNNPVPHQMMSADICRSIERLKSFGHSFSSVLLVMGFLYILHYTAGTT